MQYIIHNPFWCPYQIMNVRRGDVISIPCQNRVGVYSGNGTKYLLVPPEHRQEFDNDNMH